MTPARRRALLRVAAPVVIAGAIGAVAALGLGAGVFQGFRQRAADGLFPIGATDERIAVVAIDSRSLAAVGKPWPWPRSLQADLLDRIIDGKPSVVVVDAVLAPPSPEDAAVEAAMRRGVPVVLASSASLRPDPDGILLRTVARTDPAPSLVDAAGGLATAAVTPDPDDGVVRTLPLVVEDARGHLIPSLALAAFLRMQKESTVVLRRHGVVVGTSSIPTDHRHSLTIGFAGALLDDSHHDSASDVLRGRVPANAFHGKVVFIGAADPTLGDNHLVPPNKRGGIPGVVIHAAALNTVLTGNYLRTESSAGTVLWVVLVALLVGALLLNARLLVAAAGVVAVLVAFVLVVLLRFQHGVVTDPVYPPLGIVLATIAALAVRYFGEERRRRYVDALFSRYVPPAVARQLVDDPHLDDAVGGARRDISVVFCDLRGFTPVAGSLEPAQVRALLDAYYEYVCARVLSRDGTVIQFVGDEVFAVFGAPIARPDHEAAAVDCALAIVDERDEFDAALQELGLPTVGFGIGVHSGEVVSAHVGPEDRRQYSVIGDTVNVGSRLCSMAAAGEIVASAKVMDASGETACVAEQLGIVELKGVAGGVAAVRVTGRRVPDGRDPAR